MAADVLNQASQAGRVSRYRSSRRTATVDDQNQPVQPHQYLRETTEGVPELPNAAVNDSLQPKTSSRYRSRSGTISRSSSGYQQAQVPFANSAAVLPPQNTSSTTTMTVTMPAATAPITTMSPSLSKTKSSRYRSKSIGTSSSRNSSLKMDNLPVPPPPAIAPPQSFQSSQGNDLRKLSQSAERPRTSSGRHDRKEVSDPEAEQRERLKAQQRAEWAAAERAEEQKQRQFQKEQDEKKRIKKEREEAEREAERLRKEEEEAKKVKERLEVKRKAEQEKALEALNGTAKALAHSNPPVLKDRLAFLKRRTTEDPPKAKQPTNGIPTIRPGGGGIVPGIDAPVSAVNHGPRRVRVAAEGSSTLLPVSPTTTPLHILKTAATCLSAPVDPRNSVIIEVFKKAGVERPLRMYEHVRDVLNSWDSDDQHTLLIEPTDPTADSVLYASFAPSSRPAGASWWLHYSHKPHKWDKRWVTLRADGQLVAAKNENGKDSISVCHMSDFDIYGPTPDARKKRIKPPKKSCFAIKSMQKASMFLNNDAFIHFFAVNDDKVAKHFHETVHRWRSWYLVNVMGEGSHNSNASKSNPNLQPQQQDRFLPKSNASSSAPLIATIAQSKASKSHNRNASVESQYLLGSFQNGIDFDATRFEISATNDSASRNKRTSLAPDVPLAAVFKASTDSNGVPSALDHTRAMHARTMNLRKDTRVSPPLSFPTHQRDVSVSNAAGPHSPGLEQNFSSTTSGASSGLQRTSSTRSNRSVRRSLDRAGSLRASSSGNMTFSRPLPPPLAPLVDLTPRYQEPPQFQRKGKGFRPTDGGQAPLIDSATGREAMPGEIRIPGSTDWRARAATTGRPPATSHGNHGGSFGGGAGAVALGGLQRTSSVRSSRGAAIGGALNSGRGLIGDLGVDEGFTGGGLLGQRMGK